MSKILDIDNNIESWIPAFKKVMEKKAPSCPLCGSDDVEDVVVRDKHNIGYVVITCNQCKKSGYFSRVDFNLSKRAV